ncbi:MAG: hypothetical protein ACI9LN_002677, partial [Saprospiraceae bacterium]
TVFLYDILLEVLESEEPIVSCKYKNRNYFNH